MSRGPRVSARPTEFITGGVRGDANLLTRRGCSSLSRSHAKRAYFNLKIGNSPMFAPPRAGDTSGVGGSPMKASPLLHHPSTFLCARLGNNAALFDRAFPVSS